MNALKFYRISKGFTMKDMSEKIGISQSSYSYIEKGDITANKDVAEKISEILDIPSDIIFYPAKFRICKLGDVGLNTTGGEAK